MVKDIVFVYIYLCFLAEETELYLKQHALDLNQRPNRTHKGVSSPFPSVLPEKQQCYSVLLLIEGQAPPFLFFFQLTEPGMCFFFLILIFDIW